MRSGARRQRGVMRLNRGVMRLNRGVMRLNRGVMRLNRGAGLAVILEETDESASSMSHNSSYEEDDEILNPIVLALNNFIRFGREVPVEMQIRVAMPVEIGAQNTHHQPLRILVQNPQDIQSASQDIINRQQEQQQRQNHRDLQLQGAEQSGCYRWWCGFFSN
jgi:hypothetical protein